MKKTVVIRVIFIFVVLFVFASSNFIQNLHWHLKGHPTSVTYNGEKMKLSGQYFIAEKQGATFYICGSVSEMKEKNCRFCKKSKKVVITTSIEDYGVLPNKRF